MATGYAGTVAFYQQRRPGEPPCQCHVSPPRIKGRSASPPRSRPPDTQSITATDTGNSSITGTESGITVEAAAASSLVVTGFPTTDTAGAGESFTVTAFDPYGNLAAGYVGMVTFSSSDPQAILPGSYTFTTADDGKHTFAATLKTAGTQSITATDASSLHAVPSRESSCRRRLPRRSQSPAFPPVTRRATAGSVTVTAYDAYGNVATGYTGTVALTSSDPHAVLPSSYTFTGV